MTGEWIDRDAMDTVEILPLQCPRAISLALSNLSLPRHIAAFGDVAAHWSVLKDVRAGDDPRMFDGGYEITPTRQLAQSIFADPARIQSAGWPFATAVHQTWSSGMVGGIRKAWPSPHAMAFNAAAAVTMPEEVRSLAVIERISRSLGGVPAVVMGEHILDGTWTDFSRYDFPVQSSQLKPEFWRRAGGDETSGAVKDTLTGHGIDGVVADTHHLQRSAMDDPDYRLDIEAVFSEMERENMLLTRVHAAAGRVDTRHAHDREQSLQELAALLKDPDALRRTKMGEILLRCRNFWAAQHASPEVPGMPSQEAESRRGFLGRTAIMPVVLEVPHSGLSAHREGRVGRSDFISMTHDMGVVLMEFFDNKGA